ncbi:MAG: hypothetical protein AB9897_06485 [Anaerolineaceae bacterium]
MLKKFLWLTILVLITACTVYVSNGGITPITPTVTPTICVDCTAVPTTPVAPSATIETTLETSPTIEESQEPTATATFENTATATATQIPSATPTSIPPTNTATATATATAIPMKYGVQPATPVFMTNFAHTDAACNWQGIAGQIFDKSGNPIKNFVVKVTGLYNASTVSMLGVAGMVSGNPYGPGSYEIVLGTTPVETIDQLTIQVFDASGKAVSDPLKFSTSADCSKNLVIINFLEK